MKVTEYEGGVEMRTDEYQAGDRIYYTGDMANIPDKGIIIKRREPNRFAPVSYDIHLDDGRELRGIYHLSFTGAGRRFWLLSEWQADREAKIKQMQDRMRQLTTA